MKRRQFLTGMALVAPTVSLASLTAGCTRADQSGASKAGDKGVEYLFVQSAKRASLKNGVLTLADVNAQTIYFSDRPERIVGHASTQDFVASWGKGGDDSFAADPPNAALSILEDSKMTDVIVVLRKPRLEQGNLLYDVEVLDGEVDAMGKDASLFIDVVGRPLTPVSVAGVRRRTRRRTAVAVEATK